MKYCRLFFSVLTLATVGSCVKKRSDSDAKIFNGSPVTEDTPRTRAIVKLVYINPNGIETCTATYLESHTLITAAHCVPEKLPTSDKESLFLSDSSSVVNIFRNKEYVEKSEAGNDFKKNAAESNHDLAIIVVKNDHPELKVEKFYQVKMFTKSSGIAYIAGYGKTNELGKAENENDENNGDSRLNEGLTFFNRIQPNGLITKGLAVKNADIPPGFAASQRSGDSGGPVIHCTKESEEIGDYTPDDCNSFQIGGVNSQVLTFAVKDFAVTVIANLDPGIQHGFFDSAIHCGASNCAQNFVGSGIK